MILSIGLAQRVYGVCATIGAAVDAAAIATILLCGRSPFIFEREH